MEKTTSQADREDRFNQILLDYVEAAERGERPNRDELLRTHPEFAGDLREFFATRDQVDRIAAPIRAAVSESSAWKSSAWKSNHDLDATLPKKSPRSPENTGVPPLGRIGDFRLVREVGRGGMGVVYEAEQLSLRRKVALKILPFAAAIDPRHLQRFRNEAQAAAQLHHSNIVPVHAVGAENGIHFYAMQFIEGQSLAQLLSELREGHPIPTQVVKTTRIDVHGTPSTPITSEHTTRRRDYFRRMAELTCQAADALEYAHQAGIVHRDIKPANLLLDSMGRLWVADFGLALIRSDTGLTATGELVGTIRYMSPEQALGKPGLVDHRTDIYSLGATLYELLTLVPPFADEDRQTLLRRLADEDPRSPRQVDKSIPIELETILIKALAKSPLDRYASAREFADDLQRFLEDRPILARRPSPLDLIAKWIRRHRLATVVGVAVLLVLTIGFAISTAVISLEHNKTVKANELTKKAEERERQRADEAYENYRRTKRAVDLFVELSDEELLDFPPLAALRRRLLEAAVAYYQELTDDNRNDPAVKADLEASRERLARLQEELAGLNDVNTALLLDQADVCADLNIQPDQATKLKPFLDRLKGYQKSVPPIVSDNRKRRLATIAKECREQIEGTLTTTQHRRLKQLFLQLPGPQVFNNIVIDSLRLDETQKAQVRKIVSEATQDSLRLLGQKQNEGQNRFEQVWKGANDQIVQLLTPTQRKQWDEMTGPPIKGKLRFPQPVSEPTKN